MIEKHDLIDNRAHIVYKSRKKKIDKIVGEIVAVRYPPKDPKEIEQLGRELVVFSCDEKNYDLNVFATDRWYSPYRLWKLAESNEFFAYCLEIARSKVASRMRRAACTRAQDSISVFKLLPLIDVEYAQLKREESERVTRNIEAMRRSEPISINVIAEPIPDSPLVPVRQSLTIDNPVVIE